MFTKIRILIALVSLLSIAACETTTSTPTTRATGSPSTVSLSTGNADPRDLPGGYFAGFGTQWYVNIHNWRDGGAGKSRYFQPLARDLSQYRETGARVMRFQVNMDGAIFWQECNWRADGDYNTRNNCYDANYRKASSEGWQLQIAALENGMQNPVLDEYVRGAKRLQDSGFHVMLAPSDFFWGNGGNARVSSDDPLLHAYLERDAKFQDYYVALINRLVAGMTAAGVSNFSLQTLNEPRFCSGGRPQVRAWATLERRIIDGARVAAPGLHVVSSAVCTAGDQPLSRVRSYSSAGRYLPDHGNIGNITYAFHMRNPRLIHIADHQELAAGTRLSYPYQPISNSAGQSEGTRREIEIYNSVQPDAEFYVSVFSEIASLARQRGDRIIVSEWSISKPDYGLPREDRVQLANDVLQASRSAGVSVIYNGLLGREGLSSSRDNVNRPSHDFDTSLLAAFRAANQ